MGTSTRILAVAFVAVVAAFIGSTILVQRESRVIDADALLISRDAAPGIQVISDLRVEVREMQARLLRSSRAGCPAPMLRTRAAGSTTCSSRRSRFLRTPRGVAAGQAPQRGARFRRGDRARSGAGAGGHREEAVRTMRNDVWRLADTAGTAANDLVLYDVRAAESAAQRIESARQRGNRTAWQLDALCALLATFAAFATVRAVRQMHRVQQANHDLTQRKAAELEQFAGRVAHDILSPSPR